MNTAAFNRIGPYDILGEIGRGGMAMVFLARDTRSDLTVALKQVPIGADRESQEILEAEQWGARLQERFSAVDSHVPKVYERQTIGDHFYVAMEYVDGENLSDAIARGPLPVDGAASVTLELARFLDAAHGFEVTVGDRMLRSLLHGDLKPRNIRITSANQVKVLDFGIAKALSMTRRVTRNDFGSIPYLSPERLETGHMDEASDLWALGVLLYEMLSGAPPFRGPDTRKIEDRIKSRVPPRPIGGGCPAGLEAVLAKTLAADLSDRYSNAGAIVEDLCRLKAGQQTDAEREGWAHRALEEPATRSTRVPLDEAATKKTQAPPEVPTRKSTPAAAVPSAAVVQPAAAVPRKKKKWRRRILRVAAVLLFIAVLNESCLNVQADRLAGRVSMQEFKGLSDAWERRDRLVDRSWLGGMGVGRLDRALVRHSAVLAERVIENYRLPRPTVREAQWEMARSNLARAVSVEPWDARLRAALRYCQGHLHRINGDARHSRGDAAAAQHAYNEAVAAFREAAELRGHWPDPFLGLARTFIYGLEDLDRGADALERADDLGYPLGDRETAQLADGYRARGDSLVRTAGTLRGLPQEKDYLTRAIEAYREALSRYSSVIDFANAAANIRRTDRLLKNAEARLAVVRGDGDGDGR